MRQHSGPRRDPRRLEAPPRGLPVRVQWDPERDLHLNRLGHRSIQIGLSGDAVRRYTGEWITGIADVTPLARRIAGHLAAGDQDRARDLLPAERPYPLSA
nr:hypothetical protein GCM10025732_04770 [Glycomyces mayteni]